MFDKFSKKIEKNHRLVFVLIILVQLAVVILLGFMKSNFHQDELFTLETAHYLADTTPRNCYMHQSEMFAEETWLSVGEFKALLTVDNDSSILRDPIQTVIKKFVFNNVYEFMVNVVASIISPGSTSKWVGIIINIPFILLGQLLLYNLVCELRNSKSIGLLAVVLYGFSGISLSFSVYTRFYCFVLAMILSAVYLHLKMWNEKRTFYILLFEVISYFCLFEAFVSSELVAIIVAGLYFSYLIGVVIRKQWKHLVIHVTPVVVGFGYFLKGYLYYFIDILNNPQKHITAGEPLDLMIKGATSLSIRSFIKRVYYYSKYLGDYLFGSIAVLFVLIVLMIYIVVKNRKKDIQDTRRSDSYVYVIVGVVAIYSLFSIIVSLWLPRYYALIYPLIIVLVACVYDRMVQYINRWEKYVLWFLFCLGILLSPLLGHIDNVFYDERDNIYELEEIDADVQKHVIWNMDDFQIIMECVYQADVSDDFYVCSEYNDLDYLDMNSDFLLWISRSESLDSDDIENMKTEGYEIAEEIGIIADANIYYIKKVD